ncbi:RhoGAP-domain-containing protein [Tilletiaria anomala UBC 951]|uniref:RhoGAP-domain-containing protein n=1 Tax=Tilletiaria anomala (strain ATCC 24038 / CBS 436.72 / UBC 951) TaxID=1037660 RepID=A0A066WIM5_TILAU|nr:RhoGAP-domain-containing protein [Tilletiaria anomala UBC 951]KDN52383.1 RhoGAP-domain-containing protein [Tilletiaria anomala UBC 951]
MAAMLLSQSGGGGGPGAIDSASTASNALSLHFLANGPGSSISTTTSSPSLTASSLTYQPLSLADAMARANVDPTSALEEVLAERNKFCLEAGKLSNENMRIWSLMGKIRKENEALKAKIAELERWSPSSLSKMSPIGGNAPTAAATPAATPAAPMSAAHSTPTLSAPPGRAPVGTPGQGSSDLTSPIDVTSSPFPTGSAPQTPMQQHFGNSSAAAASSTITVMTAVESASASSAAIMQQRAAAQQRSLEGAQGRTSMESQDFEVEAVEASDAEASGSERQSLQAGAILQSAMTPPSAAAAADINASFLSQGAQPLSPTRLRGDTYSGIAGANPVPARDSAVTKNTRALELSDLLANAAVESSSNMPRVDGSMLHTLQVSVTSSVIKATSGKERDVCSFLIRIENPAVPPPPPPPSESGRGNLNGTGGPPRVWKVEKTYAEITALDARLRQKWGKSGSKKLAHVAPPDKSLFKDHAPSKVDQRKAMLDKWLHDCISAQLPDRDDIATFLCTDVVLHDKPKPSGSAVREGYLTKKGQNLGRWVTRYYVLRATRLDFFETRGGQQIGTINIHGAQIGRQQKSATSDMDDNSYRHAFLVLERRSGGANGLPGAGTSIAAAGEGSGPGGCGGVGGAQSAQLVRHVLCAESDADRDEWVDSLVRTIGEMESVSKPPLSPTQPQPQLQPFGEAPQQQHHLQQAHLHHMHIPPTSSLLGGAPDLAPDAHSTGVPSMPSSPSYPPASTPAPLVLPPSGPQLGTPSASANMSVLPSAQTRPGTSGSLSRRLRGTGGSGSISTVGDGSSSLGHHPVSSPPMGTMALPDSSVHSSFPRAPSPDQGSSANGHEAAAALASGGMPSTPQRANAKLPISGPMNGAPIPLGYKFGSKDDVGSADGHGKKDDKKRFWQGLRPFGGDKGKTEHRPVFGVPLAEAVAASSIGDKTGLPPVVYRCIEYLEKRNAALEEGIYRLSGSSAVIKALKDKFTAEGDVDLLAGDQFYDPHAIAGLLKTYLRELPTSVLTRELHMEFMRVNDVPERVDRINELGQLVCMLPMPNYALLRILCGHLIKIIQHSDVNKMTMRNVGIVFSPTLAIPAGVFALFLTEFDWVFFTDAHGEPAPKQMPQATEEAEELPPPQHADASVAGLSLPSPRSGGRNNNRASFISGSMMRTGDGTTVQVGRSNRNSLQYKDSDLDRFLGLSKTGGTPIVGEEDMVAAVNSISQQYPRDDSEDFRKDADAALIYGEQNTSPRQEIRAS